MANYDASIRVKTDVDAGNLEEVVKAFENVEKSADDATDSVEELNKEISNADADAYNKQGKALEKVNAELDKNIEKKKETNIWSKEEETRIDAIIAKMKEKQELEQGTASANDPKTASFDWGKSAEESSKINAEVEKIASSMQNASKEVSDTNEHMNLLRVDVEEYANALKALEKEGKYFGDSDYDRVYVAWKNAANAVKEYEENLNQMTTKGMAEKAEKDAAAQEKAAKAAAEKERVEARIAAEAEKNLQIANAKLQKQIEEEAEAKRLASIKESSTISDKRIVDILEEEVALKKRLKELEAAGVTAGYQEHDAITGRLSAIKEEVNAYSNGFKKASNSGKKFFDTVAKGSKKSSGLLGTISSRLKGIALSLLVFNWISKGFNAMVSSMKEGFKNLAQYSSDYNNSMSALKSESAQLKNSLAAAFEPVANVIFPYVTQLVTWLNTAADSFARFMAAMSGKSTYTKAKKQMVDYAKSLDSAKSSASGALAAFDSLNVLSKDDGGSTTKAGGETTGADAFETADVGNDMQALVDSLQPFKDMLDTWKQGLDFEPLTASLDNLKTACEPFVGYLRDGMKWFLENILLPFGTWTINSALPTFFNLLSSALGAVSSVIDAIRPSMDYLWNNVLAPIASFTGELAIWALNTLSQAFQDFSAMVNEKGEKINKILMFFAHAFEIVWMVVKPIIQVLQAALKQHFNYIIRTVGRIIDVLSGIIDFITGVFTGDWEKAWSGLTEIFKGIFNNIIDLFERVINTIVGGLNMISIDVPDWVPGIGGRHFGIDIEELKIPRLATGGITNRPTTALIGEAGREAVLPLENNTEWMDDLADRIGSRNITIRFTGSLAELGRVLKPVIDAEGSRIGTNLRTD